MFLIIKIESGHRETLAELKSEDDAAILSCEYRLIYPNAVIIVEEYL